MADKLKLMRGLPIPDPNFIHGLSSWTFGGFNTSEREIIGVSTSQAVADFTADPGATGSALLLDISGSPAAGSPGTDYIASGMTPYGVGAGPFRSATADTVTFHVVMVAKTYGVLSNNSSGLAWAQLKGYNEDGTNVTTTPMDAGANEGQFYDTSSDEFDYAATYTLFQATCVATLATIGLTTRYWKLFVYFCTPALGSSPKVSIQFIGVGIPYDTEGLDEITSWYTAQFSHASVSEMQHNGQRFRPRKRMGDCAAKSVVGNFTFPLLSGADKRLIQAVGHWVAPGQVASVTPGGTTLQRELSTHGTPSPALVIPNRADFKRAFYANYPEPEFAQVSGAYANAPFWPDSGALWATTLSLSEEL